MIMELGERLSEKIGRPEQVPLIEENLSEKFS